MMYNYNPFDWYWYVGGDGPHIDAPGDPLTGDESQVYSSARDLYVPVSDPAYNAWLTDRSAVYGLFDPTTRIDTQDNLVIVLQAYGLNPQFGA